MSLSSVSVNKMRDDFSKMLSVVGQSVVRTPVIKKISNTYGTVSFEDGTDETIVVSINRQDSRWNREESGAFEDADVIMYTKYDQEINLHDKIRYNNKLYRVEKEPLNNLISNSVIFKKCGLYLIDN